MSIIFNESFLNNLIDRQILRRNGEIISFTKELRDDFDKFSEILNTPPYEKTLIIIPEYRIDLLKLIFFEISYTVIGKRSRSVNIITDNPGRTFILNFFSEYEADRGDLKILFFRYYKQNISFIVNNKIPQSDSDSVLIFYRTFNLLLGNKIQNRSVCLITLEDLNKLGKDYQNCFCELKKDSWNLFNFSDNGFLPDDGQIIPPHVCQFPETWDKILINSSGLSEKSLRFIQDSYFFYNTVCLPLKMCYDEWDVTIDEKPLFPSKRLNTDNLIPESEKNSLIEFIIPIEQILQDNNPKYKKLNQILSEISLKGSKQCILLPSCNSVQSFVYYYKGNKNTIFINDSEWVILTQDDLFVNVSYSNHVYQNIIFPFLPNPLALLVAKKFAENLIFILYSGELSLYETLIKETASFPQKLKTILKCEDIITSEPGFVKYQHLLRNQKQKSYHTPPPGIDKNHYIFHAADRQIITVRGDQDVILFRRRFSQPYLRYQWIHPQSVKTGDVIFIIPDDIRKELLIEFMKNELFETAEDIELYIEFLACWKKALRHVERMGLPVSEIHSRLQKGGLSKDLMTIKGWFRGLCDDPIKCALDSLLSKDMNIGPQNENDILKFGEVFNLERIINNYAEIFNSMKYFRERLINKGFLVSNKVIQNLNDFNFRVKCNMIKISHIDIKFDEDLRSDQ